MPSIRFNDLLEIYRNSQISGQGQDSHLMVPSQAVVDLLARIETDDEAAGDSGITLLDDIDTVAVGATVRVRFESPRTGLGILAWTIDGLLDAPSARIEEPPRYYLIDPRFTPDDVPVPDVLLRYRTVLKLVVLFAEAASYLDRVRADLVFVKDGKFVVPIRFDADDLAQLYVADAERLIGLFDGDLHKEQKLEILSDALVDLCRAQQTSSRFEFLMRNLRDLADAVRDGYKLFASSFSYAKIRSEIEAARIEYTTKIHKTIVDIQNQLLGIPVATVVVASQMKAPTACGIELWVDFAVLIGAWIFVGLLILAIVNQWLTLGVIKDEVKRQKTKLLSDFPAVSDQFVGMFTSLNCRIWWHRAVLVAVGVTGVLGAGLATHFYNRIVALPVPKCVAGPDAGKTTPNVAPTQSSPPGSPPSPRPAVPPASNLSSS